ARATRCSHRPRAWSATARPGEAGLSPANRPAQGFVATTEAVTASSSAVSTRTASSPRSQVLAERAAAVQEVASRVAPEAPVERRSVTGRSIAPVDLTVGYPIVQDFLPTLPSRGAAERLNGRLVIAGPDGGLVIAGPELDAEKHHEHGCTRNRCGDLPHR